MKVLMINVVCGIRSTGRICTDLATALEDQGHEVRIAYGREEVPEQFQKYAVRIGTDLDVKLHGLKARLLDECGFGSKRATEQFIKWVKEWNPDVIHLHNIHGYYINIEVLFNYLRTCGKKIIWTLHDCWAFTGHCTYFDYAGCDKWKWGCNQCPQKREYPASYGISMAKVNYRKKRALFTDIENMQLVTPSKWLAGLVRQSFLKNLPITVINNGISIEKFTHTESNLRQVYGIGDRKIILGVASIWDRRKGLEFMIQLANDTKYKVVVIGVNDEQVKSLPEDMIGIPRTNSVDELVQWYSTADIYVNPTLEDNYPTTNIESISCGTPVVTFNTGGSPESADCYGITVNGYEDLRKAIDQVLSKNILLQKKPNDFTAECMVNKYIDFYQEIEKAYSL